MTEDALASDAWKAPYLSYETLTNFFEKKIGGNPLPPRIDTYFLDNYAGSVRPLLIATLKAMGMLGDNNEVLDPLRLAVQSPEARKKIIREWAEEFYAEQLALAQNHATAQMLWESFARHRYSGSTLRKAVVFYLSLVEDVGLPNSAHFKAPKAAAGAGTAPRRTRSDTKNGSGGATDEVTPDPARRRTTGEELVIDLGDPGTVTVIVDVRWLDLPDATFTKLRQSIKDLQGLGTADTENEDGGGEP